MSKEKMSEKKMLNMTSQIKRDEEANSENTDVDKSQLKRRRFYRHTSEKIQQMEAVFKECPNPDQRRRFDLSQQLGIEPKQVKFWFQNKRTQIKMHHEHEENNQLQIENDRLRAENLMFKEVLSNASCPHCNAPTIVRETFLNKNQPNNSLSRQEVGSSTNVREENKCGKRPVVENLAMSAMEELMRVAQLGEPLWIPNMDRSSYELNEEEYLRVFSRVFRQKKDGFKCEASRESVIVPSCAANIVAILMDVKQWANVFCGVVSRVANVQVISRGLGGTYREAVLMMSVEYHVPSVVVPTRESYFLRYCKQHVDGVWAVVDVSLDHLHTTSSVTCRRRPSGCLVQDIPNGYSKVIWVEHVEVKDGGIQNIYKPIVTSGLAFGAPRWVAILEGFCQRLLTTYTNGVSLENANNSFKGENEDGRRNMLKLAERMVTRYCCRVNASNLNSWMTLPGNGNENVKFMARTNVDDPTMPFGVLLSITTSSWLPIPPKTVFHFLSDNKTRKLWDMLLNGGDVEEIEHIVSGKEELNRVTLYQIKGAESSSRQMVMLQESRSDPTASYVVYAPMDIVCAKAVLGGEDPSRIPLLPSGFAILPDGPFDPARPDSGGSLLTVALQILIDTTPNTNLSMGVVSLASCKLLWSTLEKIKQALIAR